jgi:hypothetical protein
VALPIRLCANGREDAQGLRTSRLMFNGWEEADSSDRSRPDRHHAWVNGDS